MINYLVLTARVALGVVLVVSLTQKTLGRAAFEDFLTWIRELAVVPPRLLRATAVAMVTVEASAVVLIAVPGTQTIGLALASAVIGFFAASIAWLTRRDVSVACRCFGAFATGPMGPVEMVRNLVLAVIGALAAAAAFAGPAVDPPAADAVLAMLLGSAIAMVTIRLDDIRQLFAPAHLAAGHRQ